MVKFYGYDRVRPALEQLRNGFEEGNLLNIMQKNSELFASVMCDDQIAINATALEELYTVSFSETGCSDRRLENRCISFWRDLLLSCEEGECDITLEDILIFWTGVPCVPPLGFEFKPTICFQKDCIYPTANTCGLQLRLPLIHETYEKFKFYITFGIANCKDFAFA
ncbi:hypothetical protein NQ315_004546 [Exocentrus adspersus]|nr:hypothetical protein NQ315_004546 [Exocentrus adspersus]